VKKRVEADPRRVHGKKLLSAWRWRKPAEERQTDTQTAPRELGRAPDGAGSGKPEISSVWAAAGFSGSVFRVFSRTDGRLSRTVAAFTGSTMTASAGSKNRGLLSLIRRHRPNLRPEQHAKLAQYLRENPALAAIYRFKQKLCYLLLEKHVSQKNAQS
jgi:hypothetical protein